MPDYFSLQCILIYNESIFAWILININAISYAFIDSFFMCKHQFLTKFIHTSLNLEVFNGQNADHITHIVILSMFISEELTQYTLFLVTELSKQDIILDYS